LKHECEYEEEQRKVLQQQQKEDGEQKEVEGPCAICLEDEIDFPIYFLLEVYMMEYQLANRGGRRTALPELQGRHTGVYRSNLCASDGIICPMC